jgi:hypothetical protein
MRTERTVPLFHVVNLDAVRMESLPVRITQEPIVRQESVKTANTDAVSITKPLERMHREQIVRQIVEVDSQIYAITQQMT